MAVSARVVLGEDDVLLREGIARLLAEGGFEVVAKRGTYGLSTSARKTEQHRLAIERPIDDLNERLADWRKAKADSDCSLPV